MDLSVVRGNSVSSLIAGNFIFGFDRNGTGAVAGFRQLGAGGGFNHLDFDLVATVSPTDLASIGGGFAFWGGGGNRFVTGGQKFIAQKNRHSS